ncbi:MAG: amidase [Verrucomicrobia bacterium]|nr:amidase [Cytophagales bacterium]
MKYFSPKKFLFLITCCAGSFVFGAILNIPDNQPITSQVIDQAAQLIGLSFSPAEKDSIINELEDNRNSYEKIRKIPLSNDVVPALEFNPIPTGFKYTVGKNILQINTPKNVSLPQNRDELAFYTIPQLAELLRTRKITSVELTTFFIDRIKKYSPNLMCVVTLTEELAMQQARQADVEIKAGKYKGFLHGIPYGAKDLLAKKGYKTTWGSVPYKEQVIDMDATVIRKLEQAGAVLVAKLTLGELAWGDVWFGGMTRNPWNLTQGSSGSSAGSASSVSAGLLPFAIGTETLGSIVSPSSVCGVTGLRPTYGRVSRYGAMALSWSMDKIGPMCRNVEDCAIVFSAIEGADGLDSHVVEADFAYSSKTDIKKLRVGYLKKEFEKTYRNKATDSLTLQKLRELGVELVPLELPDYPVGDMTIILNAEAAAAFDELTRTGKDDLMVRQVKNAWPNAFRASRFIPAVEYIQANRLRKKLIEDMYATTKNIDVYLAPAFGGTNLTLTNLTGHPCVVLPNGFRENGTPTSITFMGQLFGEGNLMALAKAYQDATDFHLKHPVLK